ncbi:hypothetical protein KJ840_00760 [Patescibacteria group bacterium]|nr:hypothetical protein [Patescibacteria group bacterium]
MFNPQNNIAANEEETNLQTTSEMSNNEEPAEILEADIHTMPDKFLKPARAPKKERKISFLVLGILTFVVLGGVIAVAVVFLSRQSAPQPLPPLAQQPLVNQASVNDNSNTNQNLDNPQKRDLQRLEDIISIKTALSLYFSEQNVYPNSLETLVGDYLIEMPLNPAPGGQDYEYESANDQLDYHLKFELETGGVLGSVKLSAGEYIVSSSQLITQDEFAEQQNANLNSNLNQNQNINSLPSIPAIPGKIVQPTMGLDSDGDQLTDIEENIYQTDSALADTDGDGYTDAAEILNFYDPTVAGGRLMDSGLIEVYQNPVFNYSLLYPKAWVARSLTVDNKEIIFTSSTGEFVEIIVQENPLTLSAYNWYSNLNPGVDISEINSLIIDGLPAIQTPDGLTSYLAAGTKIYAITYNIGTGNQMNFQTTYQLFLKSFMFIAPEAEPEPEE